MVTTLSEKKEVLVYLQSEGSDGNGGVGENTLQSRTAQREMNEPEGKNGLACGLWVEGACSRERISPR